MVFLFLDSSMYEYTLFFQNTLFLQKYSIFQEFLLSKKTFLYLRVLCLFMVDGYFFYRFFFAMDIILPRSSSYSLRLIFISFFMNYLLQFCFHIHDFILLIYSYQTSNNAKFTQLRKNIIERKNCFSPFFS